MATNTITHFTTSTRGDGTRFVGLTPDAPEWLHDAIREAHEYGEILPNDWVYRVASMTADEINYELESCDPEQVDPQEVAWRLADGMASTCSTPDLFAWLTDYPMAQAYVDEVLACSHPSSIGTAVRDGYSNAVTVVAEMIARAWRATV